MAYLRNVMLSVSVIGEAAMPLVTITAKSPYYPANDPIDDTEKQALTARLGEALPSLIIDNLSRLHLEADTPLDGVQVNYQKFHARAIHAPDIWVGILFTGVPPEEIAQIAVRRALDDIVTTYLEQQESTAELAVDVFWGPGRGFFVIDGHRVEW